MENKINRASDKLGIKGSIPIKKETLHPNKNYSVDEQVILLYLLSLPPQWVLRQDWVIHQYDGIMGRNRVKKAWTSLKIKGHLIKKTGTNFTDVYWIVYELPIDRNPVYRKPVDRELVYNNTNNKDIDNKDIDNKDIDNKDIDNKDNNTSNILGEFENSNNFLYICNKNIEDMALTPEQQKLIDVKNELRTEFNKVDENLLFDCIKNKDEHLLPLMQSINLKRGEVFTVAKELTSTQKELCENYRQIEKEFSTSRSEENL